MSPESDPTREAEAMDRVFHTLDRVNPNPYPRSWYARRAMWRVVQATVFRWSPPRSHGLRRFLLRWFGASLTGTSKVWPTVRIHHPWLLTMGHHSDLAHRVDVYNLGPVTMGDHAVVSHDAVLCAGTHDYTSPVLPLQRPPIVIESGVWVCTGAFVGPGVTVGMNSVVGARAVVMRDVERNVVVAGNPAKVVGPRRMNEGAEVE